MSQNMPLVRMDNEIYSQTLVVEPDFEELRQILERQFERDVTQDEAVGTGKFLINIYEILLSDDNAVLQ